MTISSFIKRQEHILPLFVLVDVSGSMAGPKIETVNIALKEMLNSFRKIKNPKGIINLCVIAFGNEKVEIIKPLSEIKDEDEFNLTAYGSTPLATCVDKLADMIEDRSVVPSSAYNPTIVMISDGNPTDMGQTNLAECAEIAKHPAFEKVVNGPRCKKATRLAMKIGDDANTEVLKSFIGNSEIPVIRASENGVISTFFKWVTMSVSCASVSENPNKIVMEDPYETFEDKDIQF